MTRDLGITTTVPIEVALAGGWRPVDLNNRFVGHADPVGLTAKAEALGLPGSLCAWIKGMYAWLQEHPEVETVLAVTEGDCSNTGALMELLADEGRRTIPFAYPASRRPEAMQEQLALMAQALDADLARAEEWRQRLLPLRRALARVDELAWQEGKVTSKEQYLWLLESSDLPGGPKDYQARVEAFLAQAESRPARTGMVRLGLVGVPFILSDLMETLEDMGAAVVFHEVPRQFAMLPWLDADSLAEQYLGYTYPYDLTRRLEDIAREAATRRLDGVIHYTQAFCHRQMHDPILRRRLDLPVLTLEADQPGPVDGRTRTRLEAFVEILRGRRPARA